MALKFAAKFLATYICITTVTAWDPPHETDQIKDLSNQISNLKSLLNQPDTPPYKYNYEPPVPWDSNRDSNYERYLKQQYLQPIINSVSEISEHIVKIINDKAHQQNINAPYPVNYPPRPNFGDISDKYPFKAPFGTASGGNSFSGSTPFSSDSSPFKPSSDYGGASYGGFQNQFSGYGGHISGGSSFSSSKPFSINSRPSGGFGSFKPIPFESHSFSSGDSSGRPVIPSRFPSVSNRYPDDDDPNQNWGFATEDNDTQSTLKTTPKPPQVCNCEEQNYNITSLALKLKLKSADTKPATCKAVILLCCVPGNTEEQRKTCFTEQGCPRSYSTGIACLPVVIQAVFKDIYGNL